MFAWNHCRVGHGDEFGFRHALEGSGITAGKGENLYHLHPDHMRRSTRPISGEITEPPSLSTVPYC